MNKLLPNGAAPVVLLGLAIVVVCVLVLNFAFRSTMDGVEWVEDVYVVRSGDSLWSISGRFCPDGVDRREWVDEIQALNGMSDSIIYPGQRLIVLAPVM